MFVIRERISLSIWVYSLKQVRQLRRYGTIYYVSKRMKYLVMYIDEKQLETTVKALNNLRFVKKVDVSPRKQLDMNLGIKLDREAQAASTGEN
ncbi:YlbG family protein [Lapidilactobacillus bayanensis]|uniref:YlbG family protein n=1 Tax=Lapidilactobacillus bayanensis TaxID=2485998 RepID=UPI0013DE2675|nr:YlbG family protein [Lapidilactobacillus bayanensis]